ncbi:MAG TPA: MFS transporter [Candidatus Babeliales bacterium]|nr:MFS transporter [Candidatus Babeliales bacterium]
MKKDISILIGNALDRFDTSLYGFLAPVMGPVFFPDHDPIVQLILTYATSITSLISRPLGTFLFGLIARRAGPIIGLSYSLIGVAITTVCIGSIPSHATIAWLAPLSLVCMRLIRGICAAGESTIAKLYIMEHKSEKQALIASHFYHSSTMLGIILASIVSTIVIGSNHALWRVCFWCGGITGFVGYFLRSYEFNKNEIKKQELFDDYTISSISLLWRNRGNVMRVAAATCFSHITYAVPFVFMNNFVPFVTSITLPTMMVLNSTLLIFDMIFIPIIGRCVMRYNIHTTMTYAAVILASTIIPLFFFLPGASLVYVTGVRIWIVGWGLVFLCPLHFWFNSLFSASDKYFLVGMGNALGVATLGHMTTPICLWLWYISGISYFPALYIAGVMLATAYAIFTSRKFVMD